MSKKEVKKEELETVNGGVELSCHCVHCDYSGAVEEFEKRLTKIGCDEYVERKCPKCGQWFPGTGNRAH